MPLPVRRSRALIVSACVAAALGAPGPALAQSAGNDQYQDPLAGQTTPQAAPPSASTPQLTPSAGTAAGTGSGSAPSGTGSSSSSSATTGSGTSAATTASPTQATTSSLPATGADMRIVAALGAGLLLCGFGLRLRTARERP